MAMQYLVATNNQDPSGRWTIYADDQGTKVGQYDSPDDVRAHLCDLGLTEIDMDVDGHGTIRPVPVEWIGDGEPLVGSPRVMALQYPTFTRQPDAGRDAARSANGE